MSSLLKTENLCFTYGSGTPFEKHAVKNVNIEIKKGEVIGVIGHTGSGKSTLMQMLNGLIAPTSGKVLLDGKDIHADKKKLRDVRFRVGLVFQYPENQLFEDPVRKDIAFGPHNMGLPEEVIEKRVKRAADFAGLKEELLDRSPFDLSGGEKRRAAIAGVIAMDPEILILDEPTAGLDPMGREEILGGLRSYQRQKKNTMIIVSHSMEDVAKYADNILVMNNGEIYMQGTVEEIFLQAERLFDANLDVPQITKLFIELKKRGLCESSDIYTLGYAKKVIEKLLG